MPPRLNWSLAWIATAAGALEILSWLPRSILIALTVLGIAVSTWWALYRFSIRPRRIDAHAERHRRRLGY